jgi:hypothetical protein
LIDVQNAPLIQYRQLFAEFTILATVLVSPLAKKLGAMLVDHAGLARIQRYDRWYALLQEELDLCATAGARLVAVGDVVAKHLERRDFRRPFTLG